MYQNWISEMAGYVKSIDSNHMLEAGLEGFYGESRPDRKQYNPGYEVGSDFIALPTIRSLRLISQLFTSTLINGKFASLNPYSVLSYIFFRLFMLQ